MSDIYNFSQDFKNICNEHKDEILVIYYGDGRKTYTYLQIYKMILGMCAYLNKCGLEEGDTLVTILPNSVEAFVCYMAAVISGINYAPLPCTVSKRECDNWTNLVKPKLIINKANVVDFTFMVANHEVACDGDMNWLIYDDYVTPLNPQSKVLLMTSGTTGNPKAMSINVNVLWSSGKQFAEFYHIVGERIRFWNYLPMSYLGGLYNLAMIPIACSGSFVIGEPFSGKTILNFWDFVITNKVTAIWFVPSIVQGLLKLMKMIGIKNIKDYIPNIKICFLGTAPIKLAIKQEFEEMLGITLYENFALSETTFLTGETKENIRFREQGSVGNVLPYVDIKIVPIEGTENVGRILAKSPYLFEGYINEYGASELELDENGYFDTKDLGYFNEDGVLVLSGRSRDIIKKGGNFVSLVEIETLVSKLPFVEECAAVPIIHDFYGETYVLCIIPNDKDDDNLKEHVRAWLLDNIVTYKMPERIEVYQSFPRTASGKIQKNKIIGSVNNG